MPKPKGSVDGGNWRQRPQIGGFRYAESTT
ncbi:hypothetical protein HDE77_003430 [Rhodanobacter sp. MP7CTX1]|nr:hypothetical protein [Rhodanobacter sp. MP7CTX1]